MLPSLGGLGEQAKDLLSEPAPIKAQITIKKGGQFAKSPVAYGNIADSVSSQLGALLGDEMDSVLAETNTAMAAMNLDNSVFTGYADNEVIQVQMNPTTYSIKSVSNYKSQNMGGLKPDNRTFGTFAPPTPRILSVKLVYDGMLQADYFDKLKAGGAEAFNVISSATSLMSLAKNAVTGYKKFGGAKDLQKLYLEKLLSLTKVLTVINTPPLIAFNYGSVTFEGYVKQVSVEYKKFNAMGEIMGAEVVVEIEESSQFAEAEAGQSANTSIPSIPDTGSGSAALPDAAI